MKVSGAYSSLIAGVSQQVAHDRRPGQSSEQVNIISDPVRGLCRRRGSVYEDSILAGAFPDRDAANRDAIQFKEHSFFVGVNEFTILYRDRAAETGMPLVFCYSKDTGKMLPVDASGTFYDFVKTKGIAALASVGRYLYMFPQGHKVERAQATGIGWDTVGNRANGVIWFRTGAYRRTYKVSVWTATNTVLYAEYTTPQSNYPGVLDTSDISKDDPEYTKKVTDRQSAYNTAVNQWLASASAAIQPAAIANEIKLLLEAEAAAKNETVFFALDSSCIRVNCPAGLKSCEVEDGADGSSAWATFDEVSAVSRLSPIHYHGHIVRIAPVKSDGKDAYYMKAFAASPGNLNWGSVTWRETTAEEIMPHLSRTFLFCTVHEGKFYIRDSAKALAVVLGTEVPDFSARSAGDDLTSPVPYLFGEQITYMGVIQDRLLIAAGSVLLMSRTGDYLNWFRASILTVEDTDPIEIYALGAEDDTIKHGTTYDRSMLLFGMRRQYLISGRAAITPKTASVVTMSSYEDAVEAAPQASSNFVFYAKSRNSLSSLHQIQTGVVAEAPETYKVSSQLDTYLRGNPVQIMPTMAPNTVFFRTSGHPTGFYVYTYMDSPDGGQRLFDAWSRWQWSDTLGVCCGMTFNDGHLIAFTFRQGADGNYFIVADRFSLETATSDLPYLDSMRPYTTTNDVPLVAQASSAALPATSDNGMMGTSLERVQELIDEYGEGDIWIGADYSRYTQWAPTNPYLRDRDGIAIINGRLVVSRFNPYMEASGAMVASLSSHGGEYKVVREWPGRVVGRPTSAVGYQPQNSGPVSIPIGREVREFQLLIQASKWLPMTITAMEWTGQRFFNQRRI